METTAINLDLVGKADKLWELRQQKAELEGFIKELNAAIEAVEQALAQEMIEQEMSNFTRGGRQFVLTNRLYASVKSGMMQNVCSWLKRSGFGDLVQEQVHPRTLQAWVKEQIEERGSVPPTLAEYLNVYEKPGISIRKK